jgi:HAD superfamily hydrolase (TIGR01509 family)
MPQDGVLAGIEAVVFDMDGTLTESNLDFERIRLDCGAPPGQPVLEYMEGIPDHERQRVEAVLTRHERRAARECRMREGAMETVHELRRRGYKTALLTRNSAESVRTVLRRFPLEFDCWVSREHSRPKPSPEPVVKIAHSLGVPPERLLVVGDYVFDVQAGHAAGSRTAFVVTERGVEPPAESDLVLQDLTDLPDWLPQSIPTVGGER